MDDSYDVVVAGAGIAGCTAATLLARQGLRVALLEAHRDPAHYKRLCTHYIQSSAVPAMRRLGIVERIEAAGGVRNRGAMWTRYGWVHEPSESTRREPHGYNIRRSTLDPMLRALAQEEPTLDFVPGAKVLGVLRDGDTITGVQVRTDAGEATVRTRLVIGADGKDSTVADAAGLTATELPNARFGYFATYRNVDLGDRNGLLWMDGLHMAYAFGNDDDTTVLAVMPLKERLTDFEGDREAALLASFASLPEAPDVSRAERITDVVGTRDYPNIIRRAIAVPGLALVGDAAMVGDPLWGVGCGFAFESGAMLADIVGPALGSGEGQDDALRRYGKAHSRRFAAHHKLTSDFSTGREPNLVERLLFSGAVTDPVVSEAFWTLGTRTGPPTTALRPNVLARAWWHGRPHRRRAAAAAASVAVPAQRHGSDDVVRQREQAG